MTTVAIGNCGFGFAPVKPEDRERAMRRMERTESIPLSCMQAGMRWDWESFPEFLDSLHRGGLGVNAASLIPYSPLRAYVLGNFLLWVFLSSVSAIAFFFLGVPYWPLVGPLSAFFSLAPYIGLPLSLVPPVMAAVAIPNRFKIILTVVAITVALHFIAMNFLYAKIIGRRVPLNPLMVTIAIMFWGLIWGGIGLILAVPITAALKAVCDNVESLQPYGKLLGD